MRCKSCNKALSDKELSRKDRLTGEYTELCSECTTVSDLTVSGGFRDYPDHQFWMETESLLPEGG